MDKVSIARIGRPVAAPGTPRAGGRGIQSKVVIPALFGLCAATLLAATTWSPAWAQAAGNTAPGVDPRRAQSGAKVTTEQSPELGPKNDDDSGRMHDSYEPKGIEVGSFLLLPKMELDTSFNSNVYAQKSNPKSDFLMVARPEIKLRSRFAEHMLNLSAMVEKYRYRRLQSDNRLEAQADVDGRYDIGASTEANGYMQVYSRHEDRGSPDDAGGEKPTPTKGLVLRSNVKHQAGRYTFLAGVDADRRTFEDVRTSAGTLMPNTDRDRWEVTGRLRGSYELFPGYAAVTEVSANTRKYDTRLDRNGLERDSHGYRVEGGIGVDLSQLLRGDFLVGYFSQNYSDARLKDPSGLSVRATFNWTPDKLLIIVPSLERTVQETVTTGASAIVNTSASVMARYEMRRNLLLTGMLSATRAQMEGISGQDYWQYEGRGRATYAFNPQLFVAGELGYKRKNSELSTASYQQSLIIFRVGAQL